MPPTKKKRAIVSYENMSKELAEAFAEKYPKGFSDFAQDLERFEKPDGTHFFAVLVEIPDAMYLVKVKVKEDEIEDIERWLDGEDGGDDESPATDGDDNSGELPDDNIAQYSTGEDEGADA